MDFLELPEGRLAVALGIGLVIGAERERRKGEGPSRRGAGIRTFAIVALPSVSSRRSHARGSGRRERS